ncbi:MAG: type IX secretion system membrane protein PorP/SprF [Bacteroidetes bacterium]|nr:type IX secretion system membrane protein PorP/SprF [Bacteroidota bacterium]
MIKRFTTLAFASLTALSFAQQDAQFSHNMFNRLAINPGYAGTSQAYCATLIYRNQWTGFEGAPKTILFSGDAFVQPLHGGVGLTVVSDNLGFDKTFIGKLAYSFNQPLGPGILGVGLELGAMQKSLSGNWIAPDGPAALDQAIPAAGVTKTTFDLGFGAYYTTNKLYFGISSLHLPQTDFKDSKYPKYKFDMVRHYYLMAGYDWSVAPTIDLKPSVFVKSDASSTQLDANLLVLWNRMIWAGASYRLTDAIVALVGFQKDMGKMSFKIGYSYDVTTSTLKNYSSGSHEILLGYCFKLDTKSKPTSHQNVRFL